MAPRSAGRASSLAIALLGALALAACRNGSAQPARTGPPPAAVRLISIHEVPIEDASVYLAAVQSLSSTPIKPQVAGDLTHIYVRSGDRVAAGAPLVQIDPRAQRAAVSSQDAARAAQEAVAANAPQQFERARTLRSLLVALGRFPA